MSWHRDGSHCDRPGDCAALAERRQRAREAFDDAMSTPSKSHDGPLLMRAAERLDRSREVAIETATRVRLDDEIIDAALRAVSAGRGARPRYENAIKAAFRAAGFEVEE